MLAACGPPPGEGIEALTGATVIDVVAGRVVPDATILVRDRHIVAVGTRGDVEVPRGSHVTDLHNRWVIPGLIDAHIHLQPWALTTTLQYGVTTVRDLHDGIPLADTLRARAARAPAPHLFMAIAMLDVPPTTYPDALPVPVPDSAASQVAVVVAHGGQWIKVYTRVTPDILAAVVDAARAARRPVAAHLGLTDALTAANLGVASIEHLSGIPEAAGDSIALFAAHARSLFHGWTAFEESWVHLDTMALAAIATELAATHVVLVPTLGLHETFAHLDDSTVYRSPDLRSVPDSARANWNVPGMIKRAGWTKAEYPLFRAARPVQDAFVRHFVLAGGRIATGTDASNQLLVPGAGVHLEMQLLVAAGLSPLDALRAATLWGAELLGADSLGRLRPGVAADLVVLTADPLADIRNTRRIERVMLGGQWVKQ
ncbi:MAG TPA: amidohydrolase family protein [Gemmatimonadales bacterium]|nr:amidohydrolase family protein [Gemmatimonadales bacterium]